MFDTADDIISVLSEVDADLRKRNELLTVTIVGYSAIVMTNSNNRGSYDVDIIYDRFSIVLRQRGLEVYDENYFHFHPDYRSRLKAVESGFTHLKAYITDAHDIFLLKLNAFREKDKSDLIYLIQNQIVDVSLLDQLFAEWNKHWFNNSSEIAENYAKVRG